jgi:hypothetical protein
MSEKVRASDPPPRKPESKPDSLDAEESTEQGRLHALFVDVTGTEEVVAERESTAGSRYLEDATTDVSTYVTDIARNDGLADTVDDPGDAE